MTAITRHEMGESTTVSDWLGTAALAARSAANHMEAVRAHEGGDEGNTLGLAHADLQQAVDELGKIMQALEDAGLAAMA